MIMTSGTTGIPKLAMISHQSFTEIARKWIETAPIGIGDNWISITPTAWIVDQMWGMGVSPLTGMAMNFPETLETQGQRISVKSDRSSSSPLHGSGKTSPLRSE